jgi:hypothetical protein
MRIDLFAEMHIDAVADHFAGGERGASLKATSLPTPSVESVINTVLSATFICPSMSSPKATEASLRYAEENCNAKESGRVRLAVSAV